MHCNDVYLLNCLTERPFQSINTNLGGWRPSGNTCWVFLGFEEIPREKVAEKIMLKIGNFDQNFEFDIKERLSFARCVLEQNQ